MLIYQAILALFITANTIMAKKLYLNKTNFLHSVKLQSEA